MSLLEIGEGTYFRTVGTKYLEKKEEVGGNIMSFEEDFEMKTVSFSKKQQEPWKLF